METAWIARTSSVVSTSLTTYPPGAGPHRPHHQVVVEECGEHERRDLGMTMRDLLDETQSLVLGARGELEIHHHDVRAARVHLGERGIV